MIIVTITPIMQGLLLEKREREREREEHIISSSRVVVIGCSISICELIHTSGNYGTVLYPQYCGEVLRSGQLVTSHVLGSSFFSLIRSLTNSYTPVDTHVLAVVVIRLGPRLSLLILSMRVHIVLCYVRTYASPVGQCSHCLDEQCRQRSFGTRNLPTGQWWV